MDKISQSLNIALDEGDMENLPLPEVLIDDLPERSISVNFDLDVSSDLINDYVSVRETNFVLLENAQKVLNGAIQMNNMTPTPRGYEIITSQMKLIQEINNDILANQKSFKDIQNISTQSAETINNVQNNYSMTGTEILEMIENATSDSE